MKIGILTYHWVANFGANLQALSTYNNILKRGHEPIFINWIPSDLEDIYLNNTDQDQFNEHKLFAKQNYTVSELCRNEKDIADVINKLSIELVIIGSDAVFTYTPHLRRVYLSRSKIIGYTKPCIDSDFPNPFWGNFIDLIGDSIPVAVMSASAQNTRYDLIFSANRKKAFQKAINKFSYISVRDVWTQQMINHLTQSNVDPIITPDPVFSFNNNAVNTLDKKYILKKYNLPSEYVLISMSDIQFGDLWIEKINKLFKDRGVLLVELPRANNKEKINIDRRLELPMNPLDWYYLIKYSFGYIGELMHPILVSLHNSVPIYAMDTYGFKGNNGSLDVKSSKTYQILNRFNLIDNYYNELLNEVNPTPEYVFQQIINFNVEECKKEAIKATDEYNSMMDDIYQLIEK